MSRYVNIERFPLYENVDPALQEGEIARNHRITLPQMMSEREDTTEDTTGEDSPHSSTARSFEGPDRSSVGNAHESLDAEARAQPPNRPSEPVSQTVVKWPSTRLWSLITFSAPVAVFAVSTYFNVQALHDSAKAIDISARSAKASDQAAKAEQNTAQTTNSSLVLQRSPAFVLSCFSGPDAQASEQIQVAGLAQNHRSYPRAPTQDTKNALRTTEHCRLSNYGSFPALHVTAQFEVSPGTSATHVPPAELFEADFDGIAAQSYQEVEIINERAEPVLVSQCTEVSYKSPPRYLDWQYFNLGLEFITAHVLQGARGTKVGRLTFQRPDEARCARPPLTH